jgi:hypothetical protein
LQQGPTFHGEKIGFVLISEQGTEGQFQDAFFTGGADSDRVNN